jgi:hypothetical protein
VNRVPLLRRRWLRISVLVAAVALATVPLIGRAIEIPPGVSTEAAFVLVICAVLAALIGSRILRP